jgi:glutamate formiminotransferase
MPVARRAALAVAESLGSELHVPVFLYGAIGAGRRPSFFRLGGTEELARRIEVGELAPEYGPARLDPRTGAALVGARPPLVAYNVELASVHLDVAREIAAAIRESSGGMPGVQAIGIFLPRSGRVQVSMNVVDLDRSSLHEVVQRVLREATTRGVGVLGGELVGLVPEQVLDAALAAGVPIPDVDESRVLERRLAASF